MSHKPAIHVVTLDGRRFTRKSARPYTHVVIARPDWELRRVTEAARAEDRAKKSAATYEYYAAYFLPDGPWARERPHYTPKMAAARHAEHARTLNGRTVEQFTADTEAAWWRQFEAEWARRGEWDRVTSWHHSEALARKEAARLALHIPACAFTGIRVAPIDSRE